MAESVTPLHVAAKFGHYEICQFIFNNILDHNHQRNDGCTPFDNAVLFGNLRVAKLIFENNADDPLNLGQTIRMNLFFWILDMAILSYRLYTNSFVQPIDSVFSILTYWITAGLYFYMIIFCLFFLYELVNCFENICKWIFAPIKYKCNFSRELYWQVTTYRFTSLHYRFDSGNKIILKTFLKAINV